MPATEDVWRNLRMMHVVSAASAFALLAATLWMMQADYADEWRGIQTTTYKLQAEQLNDDIRDLLELNDEEFEKKETLLTQNYENAKKSLDAERERIAPAENDANQLDGQFQKLTREVKFKRAERDAVRAELDLKVRDGVLGKGLKPYQESFDKVQAEVDQMELQLQELQAKFDAAKEQLAELTRPRDDAQAALKKHQTEYERLLKAKEKIAPSWKSQPGMAFKRWLMEQWIIEGFNGPLKPAQIWLPDLTINYGGAKDVARFDRCTTCHVSIDRVGSGNVAAFPHDPHGASMANAEELLNGKSDEARAWRSSPTKGYAHPFSTHPHPELYLTSSSPHPMQKFGCTGCHEGQGSGTSFQNASHTPNSPDIGQKWHDKYGYSYNHFWEFPMYPERLREAACLKCHHNVVELGVNPKYGASAPTLFKGYELIRQYGCFGCHEINGFNSGKPIGPDLRLEPQTPEEIERIANDPSAVAGVMRKVGPGLRHIAAKTNRAWTEYWVEEPKRFHPETRMPQFFNLTNQKDAEAKELQPVEIAGIVAYLFARSEELKLERWADDYQPDAERGKLLFSQRGCLACHAHDDFEGIKQDFGPNLTHVHQKVSSMEWLYTWVKDPTKHSSRTKMPNLYLEPYTVNDGAVDPAADIAAFLLSRRDDRGKLLPGADGKPVRDEVGPGRFKAIAWDKAGLDKLVRLYLSKVLTAAKVEETFRTHRYPEHEAAAVKGAATKPDEIELVDGEITEEALLRYVGVRTITRYGCHGCHDIPGFERARPIGTGLQDWGRKDPTKLALEHIEEYLHHHGEPDGSKWKSTHERAEDALKDGLNDNFDSPEQRSREGAVAFFFDQLNSHGRAGFLWQKLRDPRSYDYKKIETKAYDERLRMPKFPFSEEDIEAIATFVVGLVAEPPAEKYLYRPQGPAKARIEGEKLLAKYNCVGCHIIELPSITGLPEDLTPYELGPKDYPEALELMLKLKAPRDARTGRKLKTGESAINFRGLLFQAADPQDDPEDQTVYYDMWETIHLGDKEQFLLPGRMEIKLAKLVEELPARGGAFAEWLVGASISRDVNRGSAWHLAPPPLYLEGIKVQTPWLYAFLKDPGRLRHTTVLRMPQFNMTSDESEKLANYFAAADGAPFPYQDVPQREPDYLSEKEHEHSNYLADAWKVITAGPPAGVCFGCHSVGGREFVAGDPTKVTRGPDLDLVTSRLRPDWLQLWLYNPLWITPYTKMPQNFAKDGKLFPELFDGQGNRQAVAARDALMNYLRILEKEGKATAAAPATAGAAEGGKQ
jgi:cytochrome c551/c552